MWQRAPRRTCKDAGMQSLRQDVAILDCLPLSLMPFGSTKALALFLSYKVISNLYGKSLLYPYAHKYAHQNNHVVLAIDLRWNDLYDNYHNK